MDLLKAMVNAASVCLIALIVFAVVDTAAPVDYWRTAIWLVAALSGVCVFLAMLAHCVTKAPPSRKLLHCVLLLFGGVPAAIIYYWVVVKKVAVARFAD